METLRKRAEKLINNAASNSLSNANAAVVKLKEAGGRVSKR